MFLSSSPSARNHLFRPPSSIHFYRIVWLLAQFLSYENDDGFMWKLICFFQDNQREPSECTCWRTSLKDAPNRLTVTSSQLSISTLNCLLAFAKKKFRIWLRKYSEMKAIFLEVLKLQLFGVSKRGQKTFKSDRNVSCWELIIFGEARVC